MTTPVEDRVAGVVVGVCRQAVADAGVAGILLAEDRSPPGALLHGWLTSGGCRVWRGSELDVNLWDARGRLEVLLAHPADKTSLLLGGMLPLADLLPLGDLWGGQVDQLAGGWNAPPAVTELARAAGGLERLDAALRRLVDERRPVAEALGDLPGEAADAVLARYEAARFFRLRPRLVPKPSSRTLGIDLFD
jgi:hypothetical protein